MIFQILFVVLTYFDGTEKGDVFLFQKFNRLIPKSAVGLIDDQIRGDLAHDLFAGPESGNSNDIALFLFQSPDQFPKISAAVAPEDTDHGTVFFEKTFGFVKGQIFFNCFEFIIVADVKKRFVFPGQRRFRNRSKNTLAIQFITDVVKHVFEISFAPGPQIIFDLFLLFPGHDGKGSLFAGGSGGVNRTLQPGKELLLFSCKVQSHAEKDDAVSLKKLFAAFFGPLQMADIQRGGELLIQQGGKNVFRIVHQIDPCGSSKAEIPPHCQ